MKKILAGFSVALLAANVWADPYSIVIQQAKRASDQNTAEQQRIQNQEGGANPNQPAAANNLPPANPELQATVQNISDLQTDLAGVGAAPDISSASDQKIALLNHFSAAAGGAKASSASVKTLVKDLMTALVGKKLPAPQQTKLARDLHALFNSSHLSAAQQQTTFDDVQKILTDAGVSVDAATDVVTDLKKIADETK